MKRKELIYVGITLLLLLILGVSYLSLNKKTNRQVSSTNLIATSTSQPVPPALEKLFQNLENDPNQAGLDQAQAAINKLTDNNQKESLQNRLNKIKAKLKLIDSTEKALQSAEKNPSERTIKAAQDAINRITITSKKAEFQKRLNQIKKDFANASQTAESSSEEQTSESSSSEESPESSSNQASSESSESTSQESTTELETNNNTVTESAPTFIAPTPANNSQSFYYNPTPSTPTAPVVTPSVPSSEETSTNQESVPTETTPAESTNTTDSVTPEIDAPNSTE